MVAQFALGERGRAVGTDDYWAADRNLDAESAAIRDLVVSIPRITKLRSATGRNETRIAFRYCVRSIERGHVAQSGQSVGLLIMTAPLL